MNKKIVFGLGAVFGIALMLFFTTIVIGQSGRARPENTAIDVDGVLREGIQQDYPFITDVEDKGHYTTLILRIDWEDQPGAWQLKKEIRAVEARTSEEYELERRLGIEVNCNFEFDSINLAYIWRCR